MKHILSLLIASLLTVNLFATSDVITNDYTFTVHIGAFVKAQSSDFAEIKPYGFIYAQRINNLLQVYMGDYPKEVDAMKVLAKVKRHGYPDAFVTRRDLSKGRNVRIIQIATSQVGDDIDWQHYNRAGNLFALLNGNTIKFVTGPFTTVEETNQRLAQLKAIGFKDAFTKKANEVLLHQITEFEAGEPLANTSALASTSTPTRTEPVIPKQNLLIVPPKTKSKSPTAKEEEEVLTARDADIPDTYDAVVLPKRIESKPISHNIALPKTRGDVKRNSAYELQMILKSEGVYSNSLDGFYGPGTQKGWEAIQQSNAQLKKYILLASHQEKLSPRPSDHILQHYINILSDNPELALSGLKNSDEALAKAYRAYNEFVQNGAGKKVNDFMNVAIKQAFTNKKLENKPPFDYTAAYDYKSLDQLILHLRYVQNASSGQLETPCWVFIKHPKEAQAAYEPFSEMNDETYPVQDVRPLFDWPELDLLETILTDLDTNTDQEKDSQQKANQYLRSRLLLSPKALSKVAHIGITQWNKNLWKKMNEWGAKDGLHGKLLIPFKASYFQTLVRLEDYFMDKGFDGRTATGLGLSVMKSFVEVPLSQY